MIITLIAVLVQFLNPVQLSLQSYGLQHTSFPVLYYLLEFAQIRVH